MARRKQTRNENDYKKMEVGSAFLAAGLDTDGIVNEASALSDRLAELGTFDTADPLLPRRQDTLPLLFDRAI